MSKTYLLLFILLALIFACSRARPAPTVGPPPTAPPADGFDFPLDPARYGPYVQGLTGPLNVDTRFGAQNPGVGRDGKCFQDREGDKVPFCELYHAGEDWFRLDGAGQVDSAAAAGDPVYAVAAGAVYFTQQIGNQGWIVVLVHRLPDDTAIYSAYWHVARPQVARGENVSRGQVIGVIHNQSANSHLHWEIRAFDHASELFPPDTAGGRGECNGRAAGVGYTWDDDPARARPAYWGYFDPVAFVKTHPPETSD